MPLVYETRTFRRNFGCNKVALKGSIMEPKWERVSIGPHPETIDVAMAELTAEINNLGWEIKSIVPLTVTEYQYEYFGSPIRIGGLAYAAPYTGGIIAICQRAVEMSEEEYATYRIAMKHKFDVVAAGDTCRKTIRDAANVRAQSIAEMKKGMMGPKTYVFDEVSYTDKASAEAAREAKAVAIEKSVNL